MGNPNPPKWAPHRTSSTHTQKETTSQSIEALARLLRGKRFALLTGAGCSTESGIPDYRGPKTRLKTRSPIQYLDFIRKPEMRQRYWARSVIGWERFNTTQPNAAHYAIAALEAAQCTTGLITQNVDRLHHRAGSRDVIELHGALAEVRCLDCHTMDTRAALQQRLLALNPDWLQQRYALAPDGDAELDASATHHFKVAPCRACGGVLKPNVVFFGENVPRATVQDAFARVEMADALLVVGSSLTVYSGYRFVTRAAERGIPVAVLNLGPPHRGLESAEVFVNGRAGELLPQLTAQLGIAP
ncbi:MAG: NAD-dependent protein deacetylase [Myxococcota bacterium]